MAEDCIFISVLGKCPPKQQLSQSRPDGARLRHIIDASIRYGDSLHIDIQQKLDLDKNLQVYYHKNCISTYLTCAPASTPSHVDGPLPKRTRSSDVPAFNFREHCIYCGEKVLDRKRQEKSESMGASISCEGSGDKRGGRRG